MFQWMKGVKIELFHRGKVSLDQRARNIVIVNHFTQSIFQRIKLEYVIVKLE